MPASPMALWFASQHFLLLVLLQTQAYVVYQAPRGQRRHAWTRWLALCPWLQAENLVAALAVGALGNVADRSIGARCLFMAGIALLSLYLILNQLYYRTFFEHFRPSRVQRRTYYDLRLLTECVRTSWDACCAVNVAAVLLGLIGGGCLAMLQSDFAPAALSWRWAIGWFGLVLAGLPLHRWGILGDLARHPVGSLLGDLLASRQQVRRDPVLPASAASLPAPLEEAITEPELTAAVASIRRRGGPPNIIVVVIESLSGKDLWGQTGDISAERTPHLAALSRQGILFPGFYTSCPHSSRTFAAMMTGGVQFPQDLAWEKDFARFGGPTLPRHFQQRGYATGFFSSIQFGAESADDLLRPHFDSVNDIALDRARLGRHNMVHWWGAFEERTLDCLEPWLLDQAHAERPFLAMYWTCATHHPYGTPPGYPSPFPGDDQATRHRNALHYTDAALGRLFRFLDEQHLREETLVVVMADHGEAFGAPHPQVWLHSNHLYEECVRTLLLLSHPSVAGPVVSRRIGQPSDLFATLCHLAGLPLPDVTGGNLCAEQFTPRVAYFTSPFANDKWGLRDGRWKFIQNLREGTSELFNLDRDPEEQANLAAQLPQRVAVYAKLCQDWFERAHAYHRSHLRSDPPRRARAA